MASTSPLRVHVHLHQITRRQFGWGIYPDEIPTSNLMPACKAHIPDLGRDDFFFVFEPKRTPEVTKTLNQRFLYISADSVGVAVCLPNATGDRSPGATISRSG
ncbi:hypothetical protein I7I51_08569 [Histoplasma capsulatum]|uniref:Uncharacterized protein n=1 Tax=Ajellomyces capsulatus TaxID=5037 RepID=A0A8A1M4L8_AJECA|nr:hypothetical protein I7I51_08569 [Histoplasma capsulatum]